MKTTPAHGSTVAKKMRALLELMNLLPPHSSAPSPTISSNLALCDMLGRNFK